MLIKDIKYCYDDVMVKPSARSSVNHRDECNPFIGGYNDRELPIFTAPMSTVVNEKNFEIFEKYSHLYGCMWLKIGGYVLSP